MQVRSLLRFAAPLLAAPLAAQSYPLGTFGASELDGGDFLGSSVDVSGSTLIAGAYAHSDPGSVGSGAAFVYERDAQGNWITVKLETADKPDSSRYGYDVALSEGVAVIGAPRDGAQGFTAGSTYVFERQPDSTWLEVAKLFGSDTDVGDEFGTSVAIDGDVLVVGAPTASNGSSSSGAAYVFERQDGSWTQVAKLLSNDSQNQDLFGLSVGIDGSRVVVGARGDDDLGSNSGSVYVFENQGGTWVQETKLLASDGAGNDYLGYAVDISGERVISGTWRKSSSKGQAYIWERQGANNWVETAILLHPNGSSNDRFGWNVDLDGERALVGAPFDTVQFKTTAGSAHLFRLDSALGWVHAQEYNNDPLQSDERVGMDVALDGGTYAIGASEVDLNGTDSGATLLGYSYDGTGVAGPLTQGTGTDGCLGTQPLVATSAPLLGSPAFGIHCSNAPASSNGFLIVGAAADLAGSDALGLGVLLHIDLIASGAALLVLDMPSDALGEAALGVPLPDDANLDGVTLHAQSIWVWTSCSLPPNQLSSSQLLSFTLTAF